MRVKAYMDNNDRNQYHIDLTTSLNKNCEYVKINF